MQEGAPFGYATESLGDLVFRVDFLGSAKTPERTARAFALFRAAELASTLNMAAFTVERGPADRSLLDGDDVFSIGNLPGSSAVVDAQSTGGTMRRVKGSSIGIPIYIESAEARDARTASKLVILRVRMHPTKVDSSDPRLFYTDDVLRRLGPRIRRGAVS